MLDGKEAFELGELTSNRRLEPSTESRGFRINKAEILEIFDKYDHRNFNEEIIAISSFGGDKAIAEALKTNIETGLTSEDDMILREKEFGSNMIEQEPMPHCCTYVWEALGDLMLRILIAAAIIQIILGATLSAHPDREWVEGLSIVVAVFVVVCVSSITNYQKEKKFKELNDQNSAMIKVTIKRNGEPLDKSPDNILVGDLIKINTGSIVPADGILISIEGQIKIEESSLTGESDLIEKEPLEACIRKSKELEGKQTNKHSIPSPLIFSGTLVKEGNGWFIALAVGSSSKKGMIKDSVQANQENEDTKTPLEIKLDELATQIGYFGMVAAACTLIALIIRFAITYVNKMDAYNEALAAGDTNATDPKKTISGSILQIILLCVAIIVVAIPEGLPLAVTLSLAFSIKRMMNDYNLVRKMYACETMGGANYICSDKTGTLTMNIMNVFKVFDGHTDIDVSSVANAKENSDPKQFFSEGYMNILLTSLICNLQMTVNEKDDILDESKTDLAFANLLHKYGISIFQYQTKYKVNAHEVRRIAFSSARKKMSTVVSNSEFPTGHRIFMKGASEIVLNSVDSTLNTSTFSHEKKSDEIHENIKQVINQYADKTLRTICVAYKNISQEEANNYLLQDEEGNFEIEKTGFTMVCIAGIKDTLREGVKEAIMNCHTAGINVVMVTGDLKETAIAISKECGIWNLPESEIAPEYYSLTGEEFFTQIGGIDCEVCGKSIKDCTDPKTKKEAEKRGIDFESIQKHKIKNIDVFEKIVKNLRVLARSRPLDKYALVLGLRFLENVVAVTGDGTNDAQALSKSNVGFAMGIEGTDVAKDAADIIILNDNFASIVKAVTWGRNIYDCIRKFIQFQLTVNLTACVLVFVSACIGSETPISPIQMLWLNMIMDSLGSLALATEPPHELILKRKPNDNKEHIISTLMWKHILGHAIVLFTILVILYLIGPTFLVETHPERIIEAQLIAKCYGHWPGQAPTNGKYTVISGSVNDWPSNFKLIKNYTSVECGDYLKDQEMSLALISYKSNYGNTAHMTILFNVFVLYSLLNQINSRVITDEFNILKNIHLNLYFIILVLAEIILQAILIQFGSVAFSVSLHGLTGEQWGICIGFGLICFVVSAILKLLPLEILIQKFITCVQSLKRGNKVEVIKQHEERKNSEEASISSNEKKQIKNMGKRQSIVMNLRKHTVVDYKFSSKIRAPKMESVN